MKKWSTHPSRVGQTLRRRWFEITAVILFVLVASRIEVRTTPTTPPELAIPSPVVLNLETADRAELLPPLQLPAPLRLEGARKMNFNVAPVESKPIPKPTPVVVPVEKAPVVIPELPKRLYPRTLFLRHPQYATKLDVPQDTLRRNLAECHQFVETHAKACYPRRQRTGIPVAIQLGVALYQSELEPGTEPNFQILRPAEVKAIKAEKHQYQIWATVAAERIDGLTAEELIRIIEALDLFLFDSMA